MKNLTLRRNHERGITGLLVILLVVLAVVILSEWFIMDDEEPVLSETDTDTHSKEVMNGTQQIDDMPVIDDTSIYDMDDPDSLVYFYVTVRYGSEAEGTNHTFSEINNAVRFADGAHVDSEILAEALVQIGDESGPLPGMTGYGETQSNATIRVRGNTSSLSPAKSYKLSLKDNAGLWRGQTNIALNKHAFEVTRLKNKLYFDILKEIDAIPSLRTQFAVLYIKDETSGKTAFENYGLFTQVEVPTKKYLKNHGMDSSGYLYKVINFNFEPNEAIRNFDDPLFEQEAMEQVISCKGRNDNRKLLELIEVINDTAVDINYVIDTYFERENYEYWLAYNILMGNIDTTMQNFYLYSPLNGNKWYFIPWDGDGSLGRSQMALTGKKTAEWQNGISNYWGVILHQRFLKYQSNRDELTAKVEELHSWLNKEYIDSLVMQYNETIEEYVTTMPDLLYLGCTVEERDAVLGSLGDELEENYKLFRESLTRLMPFFIYAPVEEENSIYFSWEGAYDFEAEKIQYDLLVSKYPDMSNPVVSVQNYDRLYYEADKALFDNGTYYCKVTAKSGDGRSTGAFNSVNINDTDYFGVLEFYVTAD